MILVDTTDYVMICVNRSYATSHYKIKHEYQCSLLSATDMKKIQFIPVNCTQFITH